MNVCLVIDNSIARGELTPPSVIPPARRDVRVLKRVSDVVLTGKSSAPTRKSQPCAYFPGEYIGPELSLGSGLGTGWAILVDACGGSGWFDVAPASDLGPLVGKTLAARGRDFALDGIAQLRREGHRDPRICAVWGPGYERDITIGAAAHDAARCAQFCDRVELSFPGATILLRLASSGQTAYSATDRETINAGRLALAAERSNVIALDWSSAPIGTDGIHQTPDGSQVLGALAAAAIKEVLGSVEAEPIPLFAPHPDAFTLETPSDGVYLPWGALPTSMLGGTWWLRYRGAVDGLRYLCAFGAAPAIRIDSTSTQLRIYVSAGPEGAAQEASLVTAMPADPSDVELDILIDFTREGAASRTHNVALRIERTEVARTSLDRDWRQLTPNHSLMILHRDLANPAVGSIAFYRGHP